MEAITQEQVEKLLLTEVKHELNNFLWAVLNGDYLDKWMEIRSSTSLDLVGFLDIYESSVEIRAKSILAKVLKLGYKSPEEVAEILVKYLAALKKAAKDEDIEIIRDSFNKGYGKGRQEGIREVTEWVKQHAYESGFVWKKGWKAKLKGWEING